MKTIKNLALRMIYTTVWTITLLTIAMMIVWRMTVL